MKSCAARVLTSTATPSGTKFASTMNGTCGPRNGFQQTAISPTVGCAAGCLNETCKSFPRTAASQKLPSGNFSINILVEMATQRSIEPTGRPTVHSANRRLSRFYFSPLTLRQIIAHKPSTFMASLAAESALGSNKQAQGHAATPHHLEQHVFEKESLMKVSTKRT
jgi:hypothetical protein